MKNKVIAVLLAVQMLITVSAAVIPLVSAADNTVIISSSADFFEFAKSCTLDTWSLGKTVELTCDIDFSGESFSPIATFGGIFNGNEHKLSGITPEGKGSYQGVFRLIQPEGRVLDLHVEGELAPGGSKSFVGGLTGKNAGTLEGCSFNGTVKGENVIGGIAGENADSGQIISCSVSGMISGENSTGGIAGKNSGFIRDCSNYAAVNTIYEEKKSTLDDIETDKDALIESYKNAEEEKKEDGIFGHTDTGGITGYSGGILQGCSNYAPIGYQHIGYNVGGIAGRQSGYLLGCKNYGFIQGRKDVGGIVGQAEPYILLNTTGTSLRSLRTELNTLNSMINKFITDTDRSGDDAEKYLDGISEYAKTARDSAELLMNRGTDFIDDNLSEINAQSAILSNTLDKLVPVFDSLEAAGGDLADALHDISAALESVELSLPDLSEETEQISDALETMSKAEKSLKSAISRAKRAKAELDRAIRVNDAAAVNNAIDAMSAAIKDIADAKRAIRSSVTEIEAILSSKPESFEALGINAQKIAACLKDIAGNLATEITALKTVNKSLNTIILNTDIDFAKFKSAAQYMDSSLLHLGDAASLITDSLGDLTSGMKGIFDKLNDLNGEDGNELSEAKDSLISGMDSLSYASEDIRTSLGDMQEILTDLANEKPLEFVKLGEDVKTANENLFDSLSGLSGELEGLKNVVSDGRVTLSGNLSSISNQFNLVMNLLIDEIEEVTNGTHSLSDIVLDASEEDIEGTRQGKTADCYNGGRVVADRNTGGIAGALAVEYSKDPEDDIEKPDTLNFTYRTKAIVQACINDGEVSGKKDCIGGIVGLAEIGTVYQCENYGNIESTGGSYVGGIAGKSESHIRKCYAKSRLTGKRYIGGIAGKADTVTASYSIVSTEGEENTGAVCGDVKSPDSLYRNFYVDNGNGAVDGISYHEKAEPILFSELRECSEISARFLSFTVTFIADGETIGMQDIKYGDSTGRIRYPEIPAKEGHFGIWPAPEADTVTENLEIECLYQPYITILASEEKNASGKLALALCEGEFTDEARLHVTPGSETPPEGANADTKVYHISLSGTDIKTEDKVTLRILNENKDKVTVWQQQDGHWTKIKASARGKYTILETAGAEATLCLKYEPRTLIYWRLLVIALLAAAMLCGVLVKNRKAGGKAPQV